MDEVRSLLAADCLVVKPIPLVIIAQKPVFVISFQQDVANFVDVVFWNLAFMKLMQVVRRIGLVNELN